jgi:cytochrome P450
MNHEPAHPDEFSLLDPTVQECPYPFYAAMRRHCPVYRLPENGFYVISRYRDLKQVLRDTARFSNHVGGARDAAVGDLLPTVTRMYREEGWVPVRTLQRTDPPAHSRYRKPIARTFSAARVRRMRDYIDAIVAELIDAFVSAGRTDFVRSFAVPLPCTVIADQFGVPREDVPRLKRWSDALMDSFGMMIEPAREREVAGLLREFQHYFAAAFEARRAAPKDDMLSDLVRALPDEEPMSMNELLDMMSQLLTGGNDTTTGALAEGMLLLIRNPDLQARLRAEPARIATFVEEVLRPQSPVQGLLRVATEDVTLGETVVPRASVVIVRYASANRDQEKFREPDTLDVDRLNADEHLAFGIGPHFCPGAMLARQEMTSAFTQLLARLDDIRLTVSEAALRHHPSLLHRRLEALPIAFSPAR